MEQDIKIVVSVTGGESIARVRRQLRGLGAQAKSTAKGVKKSVGRIIGRIGFAAIGFAAVAAVRKSINAFVKLEDSLASLSAITGASGKDPKFNSDGVEVTYASTLIGHHVLTMRAIGDKLLSPTARIVIAGSEGARGNMPGMAVHDIERIAADHFSGDRIAAIGALTRIKAPVQKKFVSMNEYVTAKLIVAWWVAGLARRLPAGITVNAVSPGAVLGTSFARDAPAAMRLIMLPAMKLLGPLIGMNGPVDKAARRYLDAAEFSDDQSGDFHATAKRKKLVGPLGVQTWPDYFTDEKAQDTGFDAVVALTGVGYPESPDTSS